MTGAGEQGMVFQVGQGSFAYIQLHKKAIDELQQYIKECG